MFFSFIIPAYNNNHLLSNCLASLERMIIPDECVFEVIVVDDGSDDGTTAMVTSLNTSFPLKTVRIERSEHSCRSATRNRGIREASGDVLVFIDADIIVGKRHLCELMRCFQYNHDILVVGLRIMLGEGVDLKSYPDPFPAPVEITDPDDLEIRHYLLEKLSYNAASNPYDWMQVYGCNMAVSSENLHRVGGFDEALIHWGMEDQELGYALKKIGVTIVLNSRMDVLHQYHGIRSDMGITEDKLEGFNRNIDYFLSKHPEAVRLNPKFARLFLTGKLPVITIPSRGTTEEWVFDSCSENEEFKCRILRLLDNKDTSLIINDKDESTDLDMWIQCLGEPGTRIRYYPCSRRFDSSFMNIYRKSFQKETTS